MDVSFIKKEEPVDYDLIVDSVNDIYTITIKEEPTTADWSISHDAITLKSEDCSENETLYEVEIVDNNYHITNGTSNENDAKNDPKPMHSKAQRRFSCNECTATFSRRSNLNEHLKYHDPDSGKEWCTTCNKFLLKSSIKFHLLYFHHGPPFQCSTCDRKIKSWNGFKHHLRYMHRDKQFECNICQKRFATRGTLRSHIETHTERKRTFQCQFCGYCSFRENTLRRHIRNLHSKPRVKLVCTVCNHAYYRLHEHKCRGLRVTTRKRSNKCDKCGRTFCDPFTLVLHTQQNCAKRIVYECAACARKVPTKFSFRLHFAKYHQSNGHSNKFDCDCCRKIFRDQSSFKRHQEACKLRNEYTEPNSPTNTERFACDICGLIFQRKFGIVEHMRIMHSTESLSGGTLDNKFTCSMNKDNMHINRCCDENYVDDALNPAHMVTDKCKFRCRSCNSYYVDRYSLFRHYAEHSMKIHQSLRHMEQCERCDRLFQWKSSMPEYLRSFS